jgi:hypothetical protein
MQCQGGVDEFSFTPCELHETQVEWQATAFFESLLVDPQTIGFPGKDREKNMRHRV